MQSLRGHVESCIVERVAPCSKRVLVLFKDMLWRRVWTQIHRKHAIKVPVTMDYMTGVSLFKLYLSTYRLHCQKDCEADMNIRTVDCIVHVRYYYGCASKTKGVDTSSVYRWCCVITDTTDNRFVNSKTVFCFVDNRATKRNMSLVDQLQGPYWASVQLPFVCFFIYKLKMLTDCWLTVRLLGTCGSFSPSILEADIRTSKLEFRTPSLNRANSFMATTFAALGAA